MKLKTIVIIFLLLIMLPALAGALVMILWNGIVPPVCGFASLTFWQAVGLFIMGQLLSGGILWTLFLIGGGIHALGHHREELRGHWHDMTDARRREFIERRRREHFGFRRKQNREDATE